MALTRGTYHGSCHIWSDSPYGFFANGDLLQSDKSFCLEIILLNSTLSFLIVSSCIHLSISAVMESILRLFPFFSLIMVPLSDVVISGTAVAAAQVQPKCHLVNSVAV